MTASPVALSGTATPLNFKDPGPGHPGDERPEAHRRRAVLWAGDATSNGQVKYTGAGNDRDPILDDVGSNSPNGIVNGYSTRDVNLNGQVKYTGSGNRPRPHPAERGECLAERYAHRAASPNGEPEDSVRAARFPASFE
ncbi:MAG: hypothetical protein U0V45_05110 [Flavobacteriales bacterium]